MPSRIFAKLMMKPLHFGATGDFRRKFSSETSLPVHQQLLPIFKAYNKYLLVDVIDLVAVTSMYSFFVLNLAIN